MPLDDKRPRSPKSAPAHEDDGPRITSGRFAYDGLERTFHEKARLSILASLAAHSEGLLFGEIKDLCALTDGNLSRHLQTLVDAGLVDVQKSHAGRRSQTRCRLTAAGSDRFITYIETLERVVQDAASAVRSGAVRSGTLRAGGPAGDSLPPGLAPA